MYAHDLDILIIDEHGDNRRDILKQLQNFHVEFYGVKERDVWFSDRELGCVDAVIPQQAHNENSFGLLVALTRKYDMVLFLDDDTYPASEKDFLGEHWKRLNEPLLVLRSENSSWVSTHPTYYPRGFPYCQRRKTRRYVEEEVRQDPVLNMGLWSGTPDLNAIDYLLYNPTPEKNLSVQPFIVAPEQYAPICSMNLAFKPEIIPAFYQLWHRHRYDDIFSGLFLKKIADHKRRNISVGTPIVVHDKTPRDIFAEIEKELPGMRVNEHLWQVLSEIELTKQSWLDCYRELADKLPQHFLGSKAWIFANPYYIEVMAQKMVKWTEIVEALT